MNDVAWAKVTRGVNGYWLLGTRYWVLHPVVWAVELRATAGPHQTMAVASSGLKA